MYVGVPKNYGGTAFQRERELPKSSHRPSVPPTLPHAVQPPREKVHTESEEPRECKECEGCEEKGKNPLSCLINVFRRTKSGGIDTEDLLLIGLIVLLLGKEGNEDIVIILAMLLLL